MESNNSDSEDALDNLVSLVKGRRAGNNIPTVPLLRGTGLRPSQILFMSDEQKKIINYLSRQKYATIKEIEQAIELDHGQILKTLSNLEDDGYLHKALIDEKIFYRIKYVGTPGKNENSQQQLLEKLDIDSISFLKQLTLFKNLGEKDLDAISQKFEQHYYARNDIIIQQGDKPKHFFIIRNGVVAISKLVNNGSYNLVKYLEQGDFFGENGILTEQAISATITAFTPVNILRIDKNTFHSLLLKHIEITMELVKILAYKLSNANMRLGSKDTDTNIVLVISTGKQSGTTTIANAITLMIESATKAPTAYIEFPQRKLETIFGFPMNSKTYNHPAGFEILNATPGANTPELAQITLVVDEASKQYKNIVVCLSCEIAEQLDNILASASQIVVVTSNLQDGWERTQQTITKIKQHIHTKQTQLITVLNQVTPNTSDIVSDEKGPDFVVSFLSDLPPIAARRVENLPSPLTQVVGEILKSLEYTNQIGVYIPSTISINKEIDTSAYVEKTLSFMGKIFGGATYEQVQGVWNSKEAGLVEENIHLIRSFCNQSVLDMHMSEIVDYVEELKKELEQEAMAIEVNQKLMLI